MIKLGVIIVNVLITPGKHDGRYMENQQIGSHANKGNKVGPIKQLLKKAKLVGLPLARSNSNNCVFFFLKSRLNLTPLITLHIAI